MSDTNSEIGTDVDELAQGDDLVREAWYDAMDELISAIGAAEDPRVRIEACRIVLDYTSKFNIGMGENYVPPVRPERSGGDEESGEDD